MLVHTDKTTPLTTLNLLYDVGAKDEHYEKTGFAHLFEHLMFGGSKNIPRYDIVVQMVGGQNNAFTNNDFTNYFINLPKENLETAFWLESDRMLNLAFSEKSLDTQRNVVIEEYRQRYLNQPYGDSMLLLRPMAYKVHPYQWPTIGKDISHIENATIEDVKSFFFKHYAPNNAILTVAGNVTTDEIKQLSEKWFGAIERRDIAIRSLPREPLQNEARTEEVMRDVPFTAIYKAFHMSNRFDRAFYISNLLSDILSNGDSSRFYRRLVQEKRLFSSIEAYISGHIDNGLFFIAAKLMEGVSVEKAEAAINEELELMKTQEVTEYELSKVKNKIESLLVFSETNLWAKAVNLSVFELLGDAGEINRQVEKYTSITTGEIQKVAQQIFREENCSTLYYYPKNK